MIGRLRQVRSLLGSGDVSPPLALVGAPRTARLFASLAAHDRRHLVAVHRACVAEGLPADVATAGLLHDIGKVSLSGRRANLLDRTLRVILGRVGVPLLARMSRDPAPGWRLGLVLADQHAALGACRLAALGWPDAVVGAAHDHESPTGAGELAALRRIDDATP